MHKLPYEYLIRLRTPAKHAPPCEVGCHCISGVGVCGRMWMRFELVVRKKSEIWASLPYSFTKKVLLQLPGE